MCQVAVSELRGDACAFGVDVRVTKQKFPVEHLGLTRSRQLLVKKHGERE